MGKDTYLMVTMSTHSTVLPRADALEHVQACFDITKDRLQENCASV